jgi:hypothetical protein
MSKTSYFLMAILVICLGIFVFIQYFLPKDGNLPSFADKSNKTTTVSQSTLALSPASQTLLAGQTASVGIILEMAEASPTLLQFEIAYNPAVVTPTLITPGKYFTDPIILINKINPNNGRISYALKCSADAESDCSVNASEDVARIFFTVNPLALTKDTSFNIMPKTLIETVDDTEVILQTTNAKIVIQGAALPQATPSAVISQ